MKDELSPEISIEGREEKEKVYSSVAEYLSAFESSSLFQKLLEQREAVLKKENPDLNVSKQDLIVGLRMVQTYRFGLEDFYRVGNKLSANLDVYGDEAKRAIEEYWDFLKSISRHVMIIRATAKCQNCNIYCLGFQGA